MSDPSLYEFVTDDSLPIRIREFIDFPYSFYLHWHEYLEIHLIYDGEGKTKCADEIINCKKNDCIIINPNELHQGYGGRCTYYCILIPMSFMADNHVIFNRVVRDETVQHLFKMIIKSFKKRESSMNLQIKGYTNLLLAHLIENHTKSTLNETGYNQYFEKLNKINKAIKHININFAENITTENLANKVHLSEGYFCHVFKEVTGKTAKEYINDLRIKKAKDLLLQTDMSITEIASLTGFNDANYFTRVFKKQNSKPPLSYKNEHITK